MTTVTLIKGNTSLELPYRFQDLIHYHRGRKHGGVQACMVLKKDLRVLYPNQQAAARKNDSRACLNI